MKHNKLLKKVIEKISEFDYVVAVFLFGSHVSKKARVDSDVDIAILTKNSTSEEELELMGFANDKIDISIFSRIPLLIQFRVLRDGKIIYLKDAEYLRDIKVETFRKYLDYSYFINNFYKRVVKNV